MSSQGEQPAPAPGGTPVKKAPAGAKLRATAPRVPDVIDLEQLPDTIPGQEGLRPGLPPGFPLRPPGMPPMMPPPVPGQQPAGPARPMPPPQQLLRGKASLGATPITPPPGFRGRPPKVPSLVASGVWADRDLPAPPPGPPPQPLEPEDDDDSWGAWVAPAPSRESGGPPAEKAPATPPWRRRSTPPRPRPPSAGPSRTPKFLCSWRPPATRSPDSQGPTPAGPPPKDGARPTQAPVRPTSNRVPKTPPASPQPSPAPSELLEYVMQTTSKWAGKPRPVPPPEGRQVTPSPLGQGGNGGGPSSPASPEPAVPQTPPTPPGAAPETPPAGPPSASSRDTGAETRGPTHHRTCQFLQAYQFQPRCQPHRARQFQRNSQHLRPSARGQTGPIVPDRPGAAS